MNIDSSVVYVTYYSLVNVKLRTVSGALVYRLRYFKLSNRVSVTLWTNCSKRCLTVSAECRAPLRQLGDHHGQHQTNKSYSRKLNTVGRLHIISTASSFAVFKLIIIRPNSLNSHFFLDKVYTPLQ